MTDIHSLATPQPASTLYFAMRKAPRRTQEPLKALYTLHKKWREASVYPDPHHAVTTLNWWHHELEKALTGEINHPALIALQAWIKKSSFFEALQRVLHGHMHWHHLTRVDTPDQLQPTIDAIAGGFTQAWIALNFAPDSNSNHPTDLNEFALQAGRAVWWIDQIRYISRNINPSRQWIPMDWLKQFNIPAHTLLNPKLSIEQRLAIMMPLIDQMSAMVDSAAIQAHGAIKLVSSSDAKSVASARLLLDLRAKLLHDIQEEPLELYKGIVTISPRRKWWTSLTL